MRLRKRNSQQTFMGFRHICRKAAARTIDEDKYIWIVLNDVWERLGMTGGSGVPSVGGTKAQAYRSVLRSLLSNKGVDVDSILNEELERAKQSQEQASAPTNGA